LLTSGLDNLDLMVGVNDKSIWFFLRMNVFIDSLIRHDFVPIWAEELVSEAMIPLLHGLIHA
tara:strand:- start:130 stop:315 length:186 start_codon:yes stop_codon:yes gene_type:complete